MLYIFKKKQYFRYRSLYQDVSMKVIYVYNNLDQLRTLQYKVLIIYIHIYILYIYNIRL